jgi:hypothetical protein
VEIQDVAAGEIKRELIGDERLLWTGWPRHDLFTRFSDLLAIPFGLVFLGIGLVLAFSTPAPNQPSFLPVLIGIGPILLGSYLGIGLFVLDALRRRRTYYGLTNERVLIVSGLFHQKTTSMDLRTLGQVSVESRRNGEGTIAFGPLSAGWQSHSRDVVPHFYMIPEAKSVYQKIIVAQRDAS